MKKAFILISVFVMICSGCSTQEKLSKYEGTTIIYGNGGGFTGIEETYFLSNDGELSKQTGVEKEIQLIQKLSPSKTLKLFEQYETINNENITYNHPGNMYYFLGEKQGDLENRWVWGDAEHEVPTSILTLYESLKLYNNK